MKKQNAQAIILTCIDFRFQKAIDKWIKSHYKLGTYDRGAFPGVAKTLDSIVAQVEIAYKLHHIKEVILINHEDCGAYGKLGKPLKHAKDLDHAKLELTSKFKDLDVITYYLRLDGTFEQVS